MAIICFKFYCYLLLFVLFTSHFPLIHSKIPKTVLSFLKNSTTMSEVMTKIHLRDPTNKNPNHSMLMSDLINVDIALNVPEVGSAPVAMNSVVTQGILEKSTELSQTTTQVSYIDDIEVLHDAHQSRDSCKVVDICTTLPIQKDANYFYFPECIDLPQCLGGCCDNSHNCHATEEHQVKVKVNSFKWAGYVNGQPTFEPGMEIYVNMQRHVKCDCSTCLVQPICNPDVHVKVGCQCLCKNQDASFNCTSHNLRWSTETCSCECSPSSCPDGQTFSQTNCTCEKQ